MIPDHIDIKFPHQYRDARKPRKGMVRGDCYRTEQSPDGTWRVLRRQDRPEGALVSVVAEGLTEQAAERFARELGDAS